MFCTYGTSQFRLTTFQMLNNHMWLVATMLGRIALKYRKTYNHLLKKNQNYTT